MNKTKIGMSIVFLLLALAIIPSAMATVTITSPASSATMSGTYTFTASSSVVGTVDGNLTNMTVRLGGTKVCSARNTSYGQTSFSCNYATTGTTDSSSVVVNFTFYNNSYGAGSPVDSLEQSNALDNTAPTDCNDFSVSPFPNMQSGGSVTYDASMIYDAIDTALTYSVVVTYPTSGDTTTFTTSTGELTGAETLEKGDYTIALTVTDDGSNTCTKSKTLHVGSSSDDSSVVQEVLKTGNNRALIVGIVIVALVIIGAYAIYASQNKSKKRR